MHCAFAAITKTHGFIIITLRKRNKLWPKEGQTMIYKTLHSKSNSDRTNPTKIKE
jgi:hypothetical protein